MKQIAVLLLFHARVQALVSVVVRDSPLVPAFSKRIEPFTIAGSDEPMELRVECSPGTGVAVKDGQGKSACGRKIVGTVSELNAFADGLVAVAAEGGAERRVSFVLRPRNGKNHAPTSYSVKLSTVSAIKLFGKKKHIDFKEQHKNALVARLSSEFDISDFKVEVEAESKWPQYLSLSQEGGALYLFVSRQIEGEPVQNVAFRLINKKSGLKSEAITLQLSYHSGLFLVRVDESVPVLIVILVSVCLFLVIMCLTGNSAGLAETQGVGVATEQRGPSTLTSIVANGAGLEPARKGAPIDLSTTAKEGDELETITCASWPNLPRAESLDERNAKFYRFSNIVEFRTTDDIPDK